MPKHLYDRGLMTPADVAMLQRVVDAACRQRAAQPGSDEAREIALTVLALYNGGMVDEAILTDTVAFPRSYARSA